MSRLSEAWLRRKFKAWRKRKKLTLRQVEKLTTMSNPFLSQFETGYSGISFDRGIELIVLMGEKP